DDRREADERLAGRVPVDLDEVAGFLGIATAAAARPDGDVADLDVPPREIRRVMRVQLGVGAQRGEVARVHPQADLLHGVRVEEVIGGLRRGGRDPEQDGDERPDEGCAHGSPQKYTWKRTALVVNVPCGGSGPCDGSSSFSRMTFAWILKKRF